MKNRFLWIFSLVVILVVLQGKALAQFVYNPPLQSTTVLKEIQFNTAVPVDEAYRKQFELCDKENTFNGESMKGFRKCSGDPNNVKALLKFLMTRSSLSPSYHLI